MNNCIRSCIDEASFPLLIIIFSIQSIACSIASFYKPFYITASPVLRSSYSNTFFSGGVIFGIEKRTWGLFQKLFLRSWYFIKEDNPGSYALIIFSGFCWRVYALWNKWALLFKSLRPATIGKYVFTKNASAGSIFLNEVQLRDELEIT